jgi:hypothetical protein
MSKIPEMLNTKEAAAALHRSPMTLRIWACKGNGPIQPIRTSKSAPLLWKKDDIINLLTNGFSEDVS